jgi:two-component system LytT family sensor kinase
VVACDRSPVPFGRPPPVRAESEVGTLGAGPDGYIPIVVSTGFITVTHLAGFGAGLALYGLLAVMTRRARRDGQELSFATAILGLGWNAGALVIFGLEDFGGRIAPVWIAVLAYAALGYLPAVAVAAAGAYRTPRVRRTLVGAAYTLATLAALWHAVAAATGNPVPVRTAMLLLTAGNLVLVAGLFLSAPKSGGGRQLSTVALAVFAVMALHLSQHRDGHDSWVLAVLGHHASLPLAFAILYQDYRFALADVFLKRALALLVTASIAALLLSGIVMPLLDTAGRAEPARTGALLLGLALWTTTALATPALVRRLDRFVDHVLLRRREPADVLEPLRARLREAETEWVALQIGAEVAGTALTAGETTWQADGPASAQAIARLESHGMRAIVDVPTAEPPGYALNVGSLAGGRRILSEDRALLEAIATLVGRRVDALRFAEERIARDLREESLLRLTSEAELQALRAQLHPHFLFNALTTLGHLVRTSPGRAQATLYRLTSLLRAVLQRSSGELTTLGDELALVRDYLAIERERFEERLDAVCDIAPELYDLRVPPLSLQTLIENAIKHGISPLARGGRVVVTAETVSGQLVLTVHDTGRGTATAMVEVPHGTGLGLSNLARRLDHLYGTEAQLLFSSGPDTGTTVIIRVPVRRASLGVEWRAAS